MIPVLGEERAASLSRALTQHLWSRLDEAAIAPAVLCCAPDDRHLLFVQRHEEKWIQQGDDLGERMLNAAGRALEQVERVLLIGTDCPAISADYLVQAFRALDRVDVVVGPAEDGGYVLLGLRRVSRHLFEGVEWGTQAVLQQTLKQVSSLNWSCTLLDTLWDVDRPEDLSRLKREFPAIF